MKRFEMITKVFIKIDKCGYRLADIESEVVNENILNDYIDNQSIQRAESFGNIVTKRYNNNLLILTTITKSGNTKIVITFKEL